MLTRSPSNSSFAQSFFVRFQQIIYNFEGILTVTVLYMGRLSLLQYITIKSLSNHDKLYIAGKVQDSYIDI